jgi:hypothetical protein
MTFCFADESGTDSNVPIAVVGGVVVEPSGYYWLDVEWNKALTKHQITGPIHMREFTPHGKFKDVSPVARTALFTDLVRAINENKLLSVGATLTSDEYRQQFPPDLTKFSMYGACLANLLMVVSGGMDIYGKHRWPLAFILDDGNAYKQHILDGLPHFLKAFPRIFDVSFASDHNMVALQAADVLAWTVRRRLSGGHFGSGFEPLLDLLSVYHMNFNYEDEWDAGCSTEARLKPRLSSDREGDGNEADHAS